MNINVLFLFIFNIYLILIDAKDLQNDVTTSAAPTSTLQRSPSEDDQAAIEKFTKRDVKETDSKSANTIEVAAKSYDPPPEFYRGPSSTGQLTSTPAPLYYNYNYKPHNGFNSRPIAFPDTYNSNNNNNNYNKYNGADGAGTQDKSSVHHLANSHNSWQHLKGKVGGLLQDRISVGHGTSEYGSSINGGGYAYEGRPYGGQAHHVDYQPTNTHYGSSGYYGGSAAAESTPFDVYGSTSHYSGSAGNDYASYSDTHAPAVHKSHPDISQKALLAKSFLIPLASAAVLGIAAALVSNPLLLQLGTVSAAGAAVLGKRKRRDLTASSTPDNKSTNSLDFVLTSVGRNNTDSKLIPYRGHHRHRCFVRA